MDNDVINLRQQVAVVRRRWRIVALCTLVGLATAVGLSYLQKPVYSATAQVLVSAVGAETRTNETITAEEIATQVQVIKSDAVASRVKEELGITASTPQLLRSLEVTQVEATRVLAIKAKASSPDGAADVANSFASAYLANRQEQATQQASAAVESLRARYQEVEEQLAEVQEQLAVIDGLNGSEEAALEAQEQALTVQLSQLLSDQTEADAITESDQSGGQVLVPATAPNRPDQLGLIQLGILGAALGALLGIGLAFVRDHFDDAIRDEGDLRTVLQQRPVLGRIPRWGNARRGRLVTMIDPQAPASEAYRSLSSSVRFLLAPSRHSAQADDRHRVLLITSAAPSEGKTIVASNLAVAAARFGLRVILVDADLRKPGVAASFGLGSPPGLSDLLADGDDVDSYLIDVGVPGLRILAGGSVPPNPAELLGSATSGSVMSDLRDRADLVIVDSAPVTRVADTRELIPSVDLVLLVVRRGVTRMRALADTIERIRQVGGPVSGAVFNDVDTRGGENVYAYGSRGDRGEPRAEGTSAGGRRGRSTAPADLGREGSHHLVSRK